MEAAKTIASLVAKLSLDSSGMNKGIKEALNPLKNFTNGIKSVGTVAAGVLSAGAVVGLVAGIKSIGSEAYNTVKSMQQMETSITSLAASEIVKNSGGMIEYGDAIGRAGTLANETIDYIRRLAIVSPYDTATVTNAFQMNAAMGQSIEQAKLTTDAILKLGAGLGMTTPEMSGFAVALAQTGATGKITAMDMRQFANNRFGLDKLSGVFEVLSKNMGVQIKTNDDFNLAMETGKIKTDDFFQALSEYANKNYAGSVELMAGMLGGLESTMQDIKGFALGDMFKDAGDAIATSLAPAVEWLGDILGKGAFKDLGKRIAKQIEPATKSIKQFGLALQDGKMKAAFKNLKGWFAGSAEEGDKFRIAMNYIFGADLGGKIFNTVSKLKTFSDWFERYREPIIGALKGMAAAFGGLLIINTVVGLLGSLMSPLGLVMGAAGLLGAAWTTNFLEMRDKVSDLMVTLDPVIQKTKDYIVGLWDTFKSTGIGGVISNIKNDVIDLIPQSVIDAVTTFKNTIVDLIPNDVKDAARKLGDEFERYLKILKTDGLSGLISDLKQDFANFISPSVTTSIENFINSAKALFETLKNEITDVMSLLGTSGSSVSKSIDKSGFKEFGRIYKMEEVTGPNKAIVGIGEVFEQFGQTLKEIDELAKTVFPVINSFIETLATNNEAAVVMGLISAALVALGTPLPVVATAMVAINDVVKNWGSNPLGLNKEDHEAIGKSLESIQKSFDKINTHLSNIFSHTEKKSPIETIGGEAKTYNADIELLGTVLKGLADSIDWIVKQIANGLEALEKIFGKTPDLPEVNTEDYMKVWGSGIPLNSPVLKGPSDVIGSVITKFNEMNGLSIPVPDTKAFQTTFSVPGAIADPVSAMVGYIQTELEKMGNASFTSGADDLKKNVLDAFQAMYDEAVGNSIIPDMVSDVNDVFSSWWGQAEPYITAVTDGIKEKFKSLATDLKSIVQVITGGVSESPLEGVSMTEVSDGLGSTGVLKDLFKPIPQETIDSYTLMSDSVRSIKEQFSGITTTLDTFFALIAVGGATYLAMQSFVNLFSLEGSTTGLLQVLKLISDYIAVDFTTVLTTFAVFIGIGGTFGMALDTLIKQIYEEGSSKSLYGSLMIVTDFLAGDVTLKFDTFNTKLRTVYIPSWEFLAKILYYGDNTVYNALGAIQGVLESIEQMMQRVKDKIDYQLIPSFLRLADKSGEAEGALDTIAAAAQSVSYAMSSAANQVYALINAYTALQAITDGMSVPVSKIQKDYTSNSVSKIGKDYPGHAGGGYVRAGRTILVGERGAELFTPHRNGWIIPNDEAFGSKSGSGKTINIEIHDIYGDANLEQRIRNGINQGLREAEFHGIGA